MKHGLLPAPNYLTLKYFHGVVWLHFESDFDIYSLCNASLHKHPFMMNEEFRKLDVRVYLPFIETQIFQFYESFSGKCVLDVALASCAL